MNYILYGLLGAIGNDLSGYFFYRPLYAMIALFPKTFNSFPATVGKGVNVLLSILRHNAWMPQLIIAGSDIIKGNLK